MNPEKPNFNPKPPSQEQGEPIKSEKEIAWDKRREEVDKITDRLGLGIDEKIKESVAAFLVHEFTTSQSCEGHTGEEKKAWSFFSLGRSLCSRTERMERNKGRKEKQLDREWTIENLKQQQKMMDFFAEFYQGRETPFDTKVGL